MTGNIDRRYLQRAAAVFGTTILAVAFINRAINPYSLFSSDWFRTDNKPETFTHLRMVKAAEVQHMKPRALILGSSRAETGLDPRHPAWAVRPVYNLGLSEAGIYEIQRYFQHACATAPVKQAVLLLDYSAFLSGERTAPDFREDRLAVASNGSTRIGVAWYDMMVGIASWDALTGSIATIAGRQGEKRYLPDGSRDAKTEDLRVLSKGGVAKAFAAYEKRTFATMGGPPPSLSESGMNCLRVILETARQHNVDLRLAIAPMHGHYLEILDMNNQWGIYEEWKRQVTRIIEDEAATSGSPAVLLADFSGYNEFTTADVPAHGLSKYYYEASHFTKVLGDELLTRLLGPIQNLRNAKPGSFGVLLSSATINEHLQAIRNTRETYRKNHESEIADLRARKPKTLASSHHSP